MSEEIRNASVTVPRSILTSLLLNGVLAFGMMVVTLFSVTNIEEVEKTPTGYPFIQIFLDATKSVPASIAMASIIPITGIATQAGNMASGSRMLWAFSRDRAVPGWRFVSRVRLIFP